jgi:copper chaperone CopZ
MQKVTFSIPAMWADHHVLAVRQALGQVDGVSEILASAMYKDVLVQYDEATTAPDAMVAALHQAGFEIAESPSLPSYPERIDDASDWFQFQERITETDERDLIMSGDHRRY